MKRTSSEIVGVFSADPVPILRRLGGCSRRAVLLDEGVSERGLARAAAAGHVRRFGRGVYALPGADAAILAGSRPAEWCNCPRVSLRGGGLPVAL